MNIDFKSLLLIALFAPLSLFAQVGGIRGRVISRDGRAPMAGVEIKIDDASSTVIKSDANGEFVVTGLPSARYNLQFTSKGYYDLNLTIEVYSKIRDIYTYTMVPTTQAENIDAQEFGVNNRNYGEDDALLLPVELSASEDVFYDVVSYQFGEMRFNMRGYDSQYSNVYLNGVLMNDALTGYSPWSLWSGLNEATRTQEKSAGLDSFGVGLGDIGGSTNIFARASYLRKGTTLSVVNTNSMYRARVMATYASGFNDNGWAYAFSASTRQGNNAYIDGVYYNAYGYFGSVEKRLDDKQTVSFTLLGAPTERGVQSATTQEVYDLVGSNYYNSNWGYQNGEVRNSRVRNYHEPIAMVNYDLQINSTTALSVASSFRFGENGYTALTWYAGSDPRPDYYRFLPSYYNCPNPAMLADQWMNNTDNIQQMDWDRMYEVNARGEEDATYGEGNRSAYMVEERHSDQRDFNLAINLKKNFGNSAILNGGLNLRRNRTEYYSEVADLLGGDYWVDIDKFAERDFGNNEISYQNNLDYYYEHGHAQAVRVGDKYSYDYYAHVFNTQAWANYRFSPSDIPALSLSLGAEIGYSSMWREGLWRKGLFINDSKGDSEKLNYLTYNIKANVGYKLDGYSSVSFNVAAMQNAPTFQSAFISPRTRNSVTPNLEAENVFSMDGQYNFIHGEFKFKVSGYYTKITDQSKVISFYNDLQGSYDNFAMSGIDKRYYGLELAVNVPIWNGISAHSAVSLGDYSYVSNPDYIEMADNDAVALSQGVVMWSGFKLEGTPQTAANIGLSYRSSNYLFLSVDFNMYDNNYLSMNPLLRTDEVLTGLTQEEMIDLRKEENLGFSNTLNASVGKSWSINRKSYLGVNLSISNILNRQDIRTGGYEQMRVNEEEREDGTSYYTPFDSKYYYMLGTTYYLNISYRF